MRALLFLCVSPLLISMAMGQDLVQKLQLPDDGVTDGDQFGLSMALGAEWAVVGVPNDTCGLIEGAVWPAGVKSGSVYLYKLINDSWTYQQKIRAPEIRQEANFGQALALSGDTFVVASMLHPTQYNTSSVHVYVRNVDGWALEAEIAIPGAVTSNTVLALEGNKLLVANPDGAGSVYAFERSGQDWISKGNLASAVSLTYTARFGTSLSLSGNRAFVGAPGNAQQAGIIYEFTYSDDSWSLIRSISTPDGGDYQNFGDSVAFHNGFMISAAWQYDGHKLTTSFFVFSLDSSTWTLARTIVPPVELASLNFGQTILPGNNRVIIGLQSLEMTDNVPANWAIKDFPLTTDAQSNFASCGDHLLRRGYDRNRYPKLYPAIYIFRYSNSSWNSDGYLFTPRSQSQGGIFEKLIPAGEQLITAPGWWSSESVHVFEPIHGNWQLKQRISPPDGTVYHISYWKTQDKLAIIGRYYIFLYSRQPDRSWSLSHQLDLSDTSGYILDFKLGWDGDHLHLIRNVTSGTPTVTAYKVSADSTTLVPSRTLNLMESEISPVMGEKNLATLSYPKGYVGNGSLIIRRFHRGKWEVISRQLLPPDAYGGDICAVTPETIVIRVGIKGSSSEVLTTSFLSGRWQSLRKLNLSIDGNSADAALSDDGRSLAISADGDLLYGKVWLGTKTSSGEWRFNRWVTSPESTYQPSSIIVGSSLVTVRNRGDDASRLNEHKNLIEFTNLADMAVHDGPAFPTTVLDSGSSLDWSEPAQVGVRTTRTLTLRNPGSSSYQVQARIEGAQAADFQLSGLPTELLSPGDEIALTLTFNPTDTGLRNANLIIKPSSESVPEWTLDISALSTETVTVPASTENTYSLITKLGADGYLKPAISGTRPFVIEWRKNGRLLKGITQDYLWLPNAKATDAGEYEMKMTNSAGSFSARLFVAVYQETKSIVPIKSIAPIQLKPEFWGPGQVVWSISENLAESPHLYSGILSPTLTVFAPLEANRLINEGNPGYDVSGFKATLTLGEKSQIIAEYRFENALPPRIRSVPDGNRSLGSEAGGNIEVQSYYLSTYSASGLPKGVTIDASSGYLYGEYAKSGTYTVTWRVANEFGKDSMTSVLKVSSAPQTYPTPGIYAGLIADVVPDITFDGPQPNLDGPSGYVQIQMGLNGAFTGQWRFKGTTRRFKSQLSSSQEFTSVPLGAISADIQNAALKFSSDSEGDTTSYIGVSLVDNALGHSALTVGGYLSKVRRPSMREQQLFTGAFSGLLDPPEHLLDQPDSTTLIPQGTGIFSLKISSSGTSASGVGTLADGLGFTFSSVLPVSPGDDDVSYLPVYFHDRKTRSTLFGDMAIWRQSNVIWVRSPDSSSRIYPDGFSMILDGKLAKRYKLPKGSLLLSDAPNESQNAWLKADWNALNLLNKSFTLSSAHKAAFPTPNSERIKLSFYPPTGFFSGSFETEKNTDTNSGTVTFRGMMLPELNTGGGFFQLPMLPDPEATPPIANSATPILSGKVLVSPNLP